MKRSAWPRAQRKAPSISPPAARTQISVSPNKTPVGPSGSGGAWRGVFAFPDGEVRAAIRSAAFRLLIRVIVATQGQLVDSRIQAAC